MTYAVRSTSGRLLCRCKTQAEAEAYVRQMQTAAAGSPVTAEIVSTRKTHDGVTVFLHEDGSVSDRARFASRAKLPPAIMWRVWGDISVYDYHELPALILRAKKLGYWPPAAPGRPHTRIVSQARTANLTDAQHEAILASQKRTRWFDPQTGVLTYAPGFLPNERKR